MANRKRTIHSQPYIPNGGVNFDSDSLSVHPNQCTDILNYRIFPNRVQRRSGARRIAKENPPTEATLHYHLFHEADGGEILFAFTETGIYKLNDLTEQWDPATRFQVLDDMNANGATNWTCAAHLGTMGDTSTETAIYEGAQAIYSGVGASTGVTISTGDIMAAKGGAGVFEWDLSEFSHVSFRLAMQIRDTTPPSPYSFRLKFFSDDNFVTQVGGDCDVSTPILNAPIGKNIEAYYSEILVPLNTPSAMTSVKSFQILSNQANWTLQGVGVPTILYDYLIGFVRFASTLTFFSTTEYTDNVKGATVVVAGSDPQAPTEAENDGPKRILMWYDTGKGYFRDIDQRSETRTVTAEVLANGDGATLQHSLGTAQQIVAKDSLTITYVTGGNTKTITDDGEGLLTGDVDSTGTNTVNYTTGAVDFKTTGTPDVSTSITATYDWYSALTALPRLVFNFHNRVILVNEYDGSSYHRWRVRWSDLANLEQYNEALNWTDRVDSDTTSFTGGAYMQKMLVLFRENSIELCRFIGGTSVFGFQTQWHDGTFAGRTVKKWQNLIFFLGKDDVYVFDGSSARRLGQFRTRNKIINGVLNHQRVHKCFAEIYPYHNEYWLWVIGKDSTGAAETYPSTVFVYRIDLDAWTVFTFQETPAMGLYRSKGGDTINDLVGTIDEQNWTFEESILDGISEAPIISRSGGDMYILDEKLSSDYGYEDQNGDWTVGSAIPTLLETKDFTYADLPRLDRTSRLHFEATGTTIDISYSKDFGRTWEFVQTKTLPLQFKRSEYWCDVNAEHIRFKFETTTTAQFSVIRWMQALGITREKD